MSRRLLQVPPGNHRPHKAGVCASPPHPARQASVLSQTCKLPHVCANRPVVDTNLMPWYIVEWAILSAQIAGNREKQIVGGRMRP